MENIIAGMEPVFLSFIVGAIVSAITQFAKLAGANALVALGLTCALLGFGYALFLTFVGPETQEGIIEFTAKAAAYASLIYAVLIKRFESK